MIQRWEYAADVFYTHQADMTGWLNGYGEQGWELISAYLNPSTTSYQEEYYRCIFKRPINN